MNRVIDIKDNNYRFNSNKLVGVLVLKYSSPIVSVPFIAKNESESVIDELCKRTNLEKRDNGIYVNSELITKELQKQLISEELVRLAEEDLNNDNNSLFLGNMVKKNLKNMLLKHINKDNFLLTEEDLIRGLYGNEEEKGSKSL